MMFSLLPIWNALSVSEERQGMGYLYSTTELPINTASRVEAQVGQKAKFTSLCKNAPPYRRHQLPSFTEKSLSSVVMTTIS